MALDNIRPLGSRPDLLVSPLRLFRTDADDGVAITRFRPVVVLRVVGPESVHVRRRDALVDIDHFRHQALDHHIVGDLTRLEQDPRILMVSTLLRFILHEGFFHVLGDQLPQFTEA